MAFGQPFDGGYQRTSPVTAMLGAVLGILVAGLGAFVVIKSFTGIPSGVSIPTSYTIALVLIGVGALLALVGAILLFARKLPGAWLTAIGALVALAALIFLPVIASGLGFGIGSWFKELFHFSTATATMGAILIILAPITVIVALLPSTLNATGSANASTSPAPQVW